MKKLLNYLVCFVLCLSFFSINIKANEFIIDHQANGRKVSYEEIINKISDINECSLDEAEEFLVSSHLKNNNELTYGINQETYQQALNQVRALSYWEDRIYVNSYNYSYPAKLFVYYSYAGTTSQRHIQEIIIINIETNNGPQMKQFGGTVQINLQGDRRYYYYVYGSLYNNGTTTTGVTVNIGIDEVASVNFNCSTTTSYYDYIIRSGYRYGYR